jgi:catechol 2,3-dioxygenase-like lactoylglutathione lyase family enzyme
MGVNITQVHHVQIFVPREVEQEAKRFYGELLGLAEIVKPEQFHRNEGAWYQNGPNQLHMSLIRDAAKGDEGNSKSQRHVCYMVADLGFAERTLREAGVQIIPDDRPFPGWTRFYVRDPGGNYIEIAQTKSVP